MIGYREAEDESKPRNSIAVIGRSRSTVIQGCYSRVITSLDETMLRCFLVVILSDVGQISLPLLWSSGLMIREWPAPQSQTRRPIRNLESKDDYENE